MAGCLSQSWSYRSSLPLLQPLALQGWSEWIEGQPALLFVGFTHEDTDEEVKEGLELGQGICLPDFFDGQLS